ncbi:hypothetical protein BHM03_00031116 [Ensete ventricosum]|nr:hypothetical protein BHM03_00031116 [Ensete ventricosum]
MPYGVYLESIVAKLRSLKYVVSELINLGVVACYGWVGYFGRFGLTMAKMRDLGMIRLVETKMRNLGAIGLMVVEICNSGTIGLIVIEIYNSGTVGLIVAEICNSSIIGLMVAEICNSGIVELMVAESEQADKELNELWESLAESQRQIKEQKAYHRKADDVLLTLMRENETLKAELPSKSVADYKQSVGFEWGLRRMGQISYEYGYQVALACFKARHLDLEVDNDPFTEKLEDSSVPMETRQEFDDSIPPEVLGNCLSSRFMIMQVPSLTTLTTRYEPSQVGASLPRVRIRSLT